MTTETTYNFISFDELFKEKLNFDNLKSYVEQLNPNNDAWKMEAVTALLEMFDFDRKGINDKSVSLETIVDKLTHHYRHK